MFCKTLRLCRYFAIKSLRHRRSEVGFVDDVVPVEHAARLPAAQPHDLTPRHASSANGANPNGKMRLPLLIPLRLDVNPLRSDQDHDAFALWVLSSSERAVTALLHSGDGRDRTPTCDLWHVRVVVLVMPKEVEENHGIPGRNQS